MEDFLAALDEVKPAFGAVTETLESYRLHGVIDYGARFKHLLSSCQTLVQQVCVRWGGGGGVAGRGRGGNSRRDREACSVLTCWAAAW